MSRGGALALELFAEALVGKHITPNTSLHLASNNTDPTKTLGIRVRWLKDTTKRFNELKRSITETIVKNDALRLKERNTGDVGRQGRGARGVFGRLQAALKAAEAFVFTRDDQAIDAMMAWLREEEKNNVLEIIQRPDPITGGFGEPWDNTYVRSSYSKGLAQANAELKKAGAGAAVQTVEAAFNQPFHIDRLRLVYSRVFTELEGVTATMNAAIRRELTAGILEGVGPEEMARRINSRVDKIGLTRAKLIARTETVLAHNQANLGEYQRASVLLEEKILVKWITAQDERVRSSHRLRHGKIFTQEGFSQLIGAPNCLAGDSVAYSPSNLERVFKRGYKGQIIHIETAKGNKLSCSPNHPILTMAGFVPAKDLKLGSNILCCSMADIAASIGKNENDMVSSLKDKADSLSLSGDISRLSTEPLDFHGDGTDGEIAVVFSDRSLEGNTLNAQGLKALCKKFFSGIYFRAKSIAFGSANKVFVSALHASNSILSRLCLSLPLGLGHIGPLDRLSLALCSGLDPIEGQYSANGGAATSKPLSDAIRGAPIGVNGTDERVVESVNVPDRNMSSINDPSLDDLMSDAEFVCKTLNSPVPVDVFRDQIVSVDVDFNFSGHVYNLQTKGGSYIAQNIIVGNCRCNGVPFIKSIQGDVNPSQASTFL